jgi:DNA-directed RNA polymerase specialized sigma24 family protein
MKPSVNDDVFPATCLTMLERLISAGDRASRLGAANHVMAVYAHPLKVYFLGSTFRSIGDADDHVRGFFADRLTRETFLSDWLASHRQLRYWLITGFKYYLLEQLRQRKSAKEMVKLEADIEITSRDAENAYHRQAALVMVRQAMRMAEETCRLEGFEQHWQVFVRHHIDNRSYEQLRDELGINQRKFVAMARTARNKLKSALRELVAWKGADEHDIDREIHLLMEVISQ